MGKIRRIEKNPFFPLPPDYAELTKEGQRIARVNGTKLWQLERPHSQARGNLYVACLNFFDHYYLYPDIASDFDPQFYDEYPLTAPRWHDDISHQWATNRCCIGIAPRGSAKSFKSAKSMLMEQLSVPQWSCLYATSTGENAKQMGLRLKVQYEFNSRLNDDFGPECPTGILKPKRGQAPFGTEKLHLTNGSSLRFVSMDGRLRGGRPKLFLLDDPEFDPKATTSMQLLRDNMETLLFRIILPMIMRRGASCRWLATFISKRHFAWHATDTDEKTHQAVDPRFNLWDRMIIKAEWKDQEGRTRSCWPHMWPVTKKERLELAAEDEHYSGVVSLEEIKQIIGVPAYLSEYMASPGEGDDIFFPSLQEVKHGYWVTNPDVALEDSPRHSNAYLNWYEIDADGKPHLKKQTFQAFLHESRLFQTVDTSYSAGPDSDSKVSCLLALTPNNDLFVLDLWSKQCHQPELIKATLQMADKWRTPIVFVESIREGLVVYQDLFQIVSTRSKDMMGVTHLPNIQKFNPGSSRKEDKIATLEPRFRFGRLKLPLRRKYDQPWKTLLSQIEEFNPEARDGGLPHDDEIDCVSMSTFILKGRVSRIAPEPVDDRNAIEKLKDGETEDDMGHPLAHHLDFKTLTVSDLMEILSNADAPLPNRSSRV